MRMLKEFAVKLGADFAPNPNLIVKRGKRYYLLSLKLLDLVREDFYHAGTYLGKVKKRQFLPSFQFLAMLSKERASRVVVDGKAAWLFICGRDVFWKSIVRIHRNKNKDGYVLVMNEYGDCLGFGKLIGKLGADVKSNKVIVKNIFDLGDFLRREN